MFWIEVYHFKFCIDIILTGSMLGIMLQLDYRQARVFGFELQESVFS